MKKIVLGEKYKLTGNSEYFLQKFGTKNPIARIDKELRFDIEKVKSEKAFHKYIQNQKENHTYFFVLYLYWVRVRNEISENLPLKGIFYYSHIRDKNGSLHGELIHEQEIGESTDYKKTKYQTHDYKIGKLKYGNIFTGFAEYECPFCKLLTSFTSNYVNIRTFILDLKRIPYICPNCKNLMILDTNRHKLIKNPKKETINDVIKTMRNFNNIVHIEQQQYNLQEIKNYRIE